MTGPIGGIIPPGVLLTGATLPLPGQPQPLANVALASLPGPLLRLDRPILLEGVLVAAPNQEGLARLQTALGDVVLRVHLPLAEGRSFLLQIPVGQPPQQALLLSPGTTPHPLPPGLPTAQPPITAQNGANLPSPTGAGVATPAPALMIPATLPGPVQIGATVPALIYPAGSFGTVPPPTNMANPYGAGAPPPATPALPAPVGFSLPSLASALGRALFSPPAQPSATVPTATIPTTETGLAPTGTTPITSAPTGLSPTPLTQTPPQAGQILIIDLTGPDQPLPAAREGQISGTLVQNTPQGQPIIDTGTRQIVLQTTGSPPIGSQLLLQIIRQSAADPAPPTTGGMDMTNDWPALHEAVQALSVLNPQQAQQLQNSLPGLGQNLSSQLVFLLTALRLGDVRGLTGESPLRALERIARKDLAERLQKDFETLANPDYEPVEPGWRGHSLPLNMQGEIAMLHFFTRPAPPRVRKEDNPDGADDPGGTRFLFDLELSHLGPMQIEGRTTPRRLDILLRTRQMLPISMQQELRTLYQAVLEQQNLRGGLNFQGASEGWLALTPRRHPHGSAPYIA